MGLIYPPAATLEFMEQTTAINHAISKLSLNRSFANYQIQADDPIRDVTGMLDRIEQIKEAIPQAVTQSLELVTTKLSTQFELVSKPLPQSLAVQQANFDWKKGSSMPDTSLLPLKAGTLGCYWSAPSQSWDYWGTTP